MARLEGWNSSCSSGIREASAAARRGGGCRNGGRGGAGEGEGEGGGGCRKGGRGRGCRNQGRGRDQHYNRSSLGLCDDGGCMAGTIGGAGAHPKGGISNNSSSSSSINSRSSSSNNIRSSRRKGRQDYASISSSGVLHPAC